MKKIRKIDVIQQKPRNKKLRVAAYCRVSTKYESQKTSIELQKEYYTKLIENNPDWENAGVFVDYGSRYRTKGRPSFCQMIHKAMKGEIDYIITKSISRFSGNTVDMLKTIRSLEEKKVTVCFEKENLTSTDEKAEMMITLYTALAQDEVRNMSENIKWGFTQRFMNGETLNNYKNFYGFYVENGELKINEEQNVLGNVLVCGECGASFRRRTQREKDVYRCATRMEKGKVACDKSPTIEETWLKKQSSLC